LRGWRDTTVDEVNDVLRREASTGRYQGILAVADEPLVQVAVQQLELQTAVRV
jgi:hypothetical protein